MHALALPLSGPRVVIGGGPRTGKTTLAYRMATALRLDVLAIQHTDDLVGVLPWHEASDEVSRWMCEPGPWVLEGTAAVRGLRKALDASPDRPCDSLVWLTDPFTVLSKGQAVMAKGCATILAGIEAELRRRGVEITVGAAPR